MSFTKTRELWGREIRERRKDQKLSVEQLADAAAIHPSHLSRAERGMAGIGDEGKLRLAIALRCRVEDIFPYPDPSTEDVPEPAPEPA